MGGGDVGVFPGFTAGIMLLVANWLTELKLYIILPVYEIQLQVHIVRCNC